MTLFSWVYLLVAVLTRNTLNSRQSWAGTKKSKTYQFYGKNVHAFLDVSTVVIDGVLLVDDDAFVAAARDVHFAVGVVWQDDLPLHHEGGGVGRLLFGSHNNSL